MAMILITFSNTKSIKDIGWNTEIHFDSNKNWQGYHTTTQYNRMLCMQNKVKFTKLITLY